MNLLTTLSCGCHSCFPNQPPPSMGNAMTASRVNATDFGDGEDDFERDLAQAIALSKQESDALVPGATASASRGSSRNISEDRESIREKRLAALEKRNL